VGHAADSYHRIDIRQTSRHLVVRHSDRIIADTKRPIVLYESGFAPRWYVPRADVDDSTLTPVERQTFCPYKGLCSYYNIGDAHLAVWSYPEAYPEGRPHPTVAVGCKLVRTTSMWDPIRYATCSCNCRAQAGLSTRCSASPGLTGMGVSWSFCADRC
jgi:uncharacterized protein (DUF427 family)